MEILSVGVLSDLAQNLTALALKGTVTAVHTKMETIKTEKDIAKVRNAYEEIINGLLAEREESIRIAQAYREELEKVQISDEDIERLHNTVSTVLDIIKAFSPQKEDEVLAIEPLKNLISVDVLKTMQLLGFNYKAAIGEPLTNLCAEKINGWGRKPSNTKKSR